VEQIAPGAALGARPNAQGECSVKIKRKIKKMKFEN
jgi:hypothetical protein